MYDNYTKIPETEIEVNDINLKTSYTFYLTEKELEKLSKMTIVPNGDNTKREKALSTAVKTICYNTYLYLNNADVNFADCINDILNKKYYQSINKNIVNELKNNTLIHDFLKEFARNQFLKMINSNPIEKDNLIKKSFRLTKEDGKLLSILLGVRDMELYSYISSLIRFFLQTNNKTQRTILSYPNRLLINEAITNKKYLIVNYTKVKPIKIVSSKLSGIDNLLVIECRRSRLKEIPLYSFGIVKNVSIHPTNELYSFTKKDREIIDLYLNSREITISFDLLNENNIIDDILSTRLFIIEKENNGIKYTIKITYNDEIINKLKEAKENKTIANLIIDENYIKYKEYKENIKKKS